MGGSRSAVIAAACIMPDPDPPQSVQWVEQIEGNDTHFCATFFSSYVFVVITQYEKVAALLEACALEDQTPAGAMVTVLFGDRSKEHYGVYARSLMTDWLAPHGYTRLLLGIAMKDSSPQCFRACLASARNNVPLAAAAKP